jgi:hypothetical protein
LYTHATANIAIHVGEITILSISIKNISHYAIYLFYLFIAKIHLFSILT